MSGRRAALLAVVAGFAVGHALEDPEGFGDGCRSLAVCVVSAALLLMVVGTVATMLRALWLIRGARRAVAGLTVLSAAADMRASAQPEQARSEGQHCGVCAPERLALAASAAGIRARRAVCVTGSARVAFCAGMLRPRVYVTAALAEAAEDELAAVLVHEAVHMRRRDPLRRVLLRAASDICFAVPLLRFWHERAIERSELAADRAAIERVGPGALARALLATQVLAGLGGVPAYFAGVAEARVAQLLGERIPPRRPTIALVLGSLAGLILVVYVVMCVGVLPPLPMLSWTPRH